VQLTRTVGRLEAKIQDTEGIIASLSSAAGEKPLEKKPTSTRVFESRKSHDLPDESSHAVDMDAKLASDDDESLVEDVFAHFFETRKPIFVPSSDDQGTHRSLLQSLSRVAEEMDFVADARKAIKYRRGVLKARQQELSHKRSMWRYQNDNRDANAAKDLFKLSTKLLNAQTSQLNKDIEQLRIQQDWINGRESRLKAFERSVKELETFQGTKALRPRAKKLYDFGLELDLELSSLGKMINFF